MRTPDVEVGEAQSDSWTHTHTPDAVFLMVANFGEEILHGSESFLRS